MSNFRDPDSNFQLTLRRTIVLQLSYRPEYMYKSLEDRFENPLIYESTSEIL